MQSDVDRPICSESWSSRGCAIGTAAWTPAPSQARAASFTHSRYSNRWNHLTTPPEEIGEDPMDKRAGSLVEAVADIPDGAMVMIGGFVRRTYRVDPRAHRPLPCDRLSIVNNNAANGRVGIAAMIDHGIHCNWAEGEPLCGYVLHVSY
jgi:hypothetical protein